MRPSLLACVLLSGALLVLAHSPALHVNAQEKAATSRAQSPSEATPQPSSSIDPQKEARIRELMDLTGTKNLGQELIDAGMQQFRSSVLDSQPDNPRAKQFVDAFVARFQKHFDPTSLTDRVIPIYDQYLTIEDLNGLLDYYRSPLGQRMLKVLPDVARESQAAGYALGQKAAHDTMEELKTEFPEFTGSKEEDKSPGGDPQQN
jgi:hypothetical protein